MELFTNKFGINLIVISQCKLKYNIVELLILVYNWRQFVGLFSNTHICEGVSLDTEVPPQVENGMFVLNCHFIFLFPPPLTMLSIYLIYQWKVDSTPFIYLRLFSRSSFGGASKNFLVSGDSQCIFSLKLFDVFFFCFINISI